MSRRGSSNYNYDYDDDDDEEVLPANLDPTVAALLQKDPAKDTTMTTSSVRLVIAQMKLQQSRVRGNSDYAAKVMDDAIQEGARDREAWTLMDNRIRELEQHIATTAAAETAAANVNQETSNAESNAEDTADSAEASDQKENGPSSSISINDPALEKRVEEATDRANTMETILVQCLKEELDHVQAEQASIMKREEQLRARIRSLQVALQTLPPEQETSFKEDKNKSTEKEDDKDGNTLENNADEADSITDTTPITSPIKATTRQDLQNAMKEVHEQQSTLLKTQCTICHEHTATRAVIPCGHLCLCNECTTRIVTPNPALVSGQEVPHQPQCPLCRGHLLSTLHIYTAK